VVHRIRRCLSVRRVVGHGVHDAGNETSNGGKQTCGVVGKIVREEIGHMVGRSMAIQMIGGSDSRENWRHTNVTRTNSQHINQHTVTSKYLVRWANARDQVNVFDMKTGRARINNVKDVATQRYFYSGGTVTGVEEWLGDVNPCSFLELPTSRLKRRSKQRGKKRDFSTKATRPCLPKA
jgi:Protein of unknown function (DUF4238)